MLEVLWEALGGPPLVREYRFCPPHRYRFDYAVPAARVALEVEGGVWKDVGGVVRYGHVHPARYETDCRKYNLAQRLGWAVFRFTPQMLERDPIDVIQPIIAFTHFRLEHPPVVPDPAVSPCRG